MNRRFSEDIDCQKSLILNGVTATGGDYGRNGGGSGSDQKEEERRKMD